jgi:hypothetical protein
MKHKKGQVWELLPVIPATWKTEIGGMRFEASPSKKLVRSISTNKPGMVVPGLVIPPMQKA